MKSFLIFSTFYGSGVPYPNVLGSNSYNMTIAWLHIESTNSLLLW